jgi:hypothetical protein
MLAPQRLAAMNPLPTGRGSMRWLPSTARSIVTSIVRNPTRQERDGL